MGFSFPREWRINCSLRLINPRAHTPSFGAGGGGDCKQLMASRANGSHSGSEARGGRRQLHVRLSRLAGGKGCHAGEAKGSQRSTPSQDSRGLCKLFPKCLDAGGTLEKGLARDRRSPPPPPARPPRAPPFLADATGEEKILETFDFPCQTLLLRLSPSPLACLPAAPQPPQNGTSPGAEILCFY